MCPLNLDLSPVTSQRFQGTRICSLGEAFPYREQFLLMYSHESVPVKSEILICAKSVSPVRNQSLSGTRLCVCTLLHGRSTASHPTTSQNTAQAVGHMSGRCPTRVPNRAGGRRLQAQKLSDEGSRKGRGSSVARQRIVRRG